MNVENQPEKMAGDCMGISLSLINNDDDKSVHVKGIYDTTASTQVLQQQQQQQRRMRIHLEATSCERRTATRDCFRRAIGTGWREGLIS